MATATKTYVFAADAENLALSSGTLLLPGWTGADGNPPGSLEWQQSSGTTGDSTARTTTTPTWETLFGIPSGSTITDVQVTGWDSLTWARANVTALRTRMRILNASSPFQSVHSAGDILDVSEAPTAGGTLTGHGAGTSQAVDSAFQASNTPIKFEIQLTLTATGTINVDYEHDNVAIVATYTTGGGQPVTAVFFPRRMPLGV